MATAAVIARQVRWRLTWPCTFFLLMSSLDRANISFAAQAMNAELGFTPSQYGFGAGILFAGFLVSVEVFREVRIPFTSIRLSRTRHEPAGAAELAAAAETVERRGDIATPTDVPST